MAKGIWIGIGAAALAAIVALVLAIAALGGGPDDVSKDVAVLQTKVTRLQEALAARQEEAGELQAEIDALGSASSGLQAKIDRLESGPSGLQAEIDRLESQAANLRAEVGRIGFESSDLLAEVSRLEAQASAVQSAAGEFETVVSELAAAGKRLAGDVGALQAAVAVLGKAAPAEYTQVYVGHAIRLYEIYGRDAIVAYYNTPESSDGDWYMFILDENDTMIAHADQSLVGQDGEGILSSDGYPIGREIITAATEEGGWFDYRFLNPASGKAEAKHSWAVRHDGLIFGSGWYETIEQPSKAQPAAFTQAFVDQAVRRYNTEGREAAVDYYNGGESVDGAWYVFIFDEDGIVIAHPTIPENIGQDIKGPLGTDINGYDFGADMLAVTEAGSWVSYVYLNPAICAKETKHAWVVRHDGLIFGSGWYETTSVSHPLLPSKCAPAEYTQAVVEKALRRYEAEGRGAAAAYYSSAESVDGPWYVFIGDENGVTIAHSNPSLVGQDGRGVLGPDGYPIGREIAAAASPDGAWVDYTYLNPATGVVETKHSWIVRHDGLIFGSGWYEEASETPAPSKSAPVGYTKAFVEEALRRYDAEGREAVIDYYNTPESIDGPWYVFIFDENEVLLAHAARPDILGPRDPNRVDISGYRYGPAIAAATEDGDWVDYWYLNPSTGEQMLKHSYVVKHGGLIFGSGWYEIPHRSDPAGYTKAFVDRALIRYRAEGRDAAVAYYNTPESIDGDWYMFILDENGTMIAIADQSLVGQDGKDILSSDGYPIGREIITSVTEEGGWFDYLFLNPASGKAEAKHSWVIKRDGLIFGSGWYEDAD